MQIRHLDSIPINYVSRPHGSNLLTLCDKKTLHQLVPKIKPNERSSCHILLV